MPVYDQEKTTNTPSADGSHDDMGVHPERREAEVADLENLYNADSAATSADEKEKAKLNDQANEGFYSADGSKKSSGKSGNSRKKIGMLTGILVSSAVGFGTLGFLSAPNLIVNHLREILTGEISELQISHSLRYRRRNIHKIKDLFTKDGRRASKLVADMETRGYKARFNRNGTLAGIEYRPGGFGISGSNFEALDMHLSEYLERRHPFRSSRWKTKRMNSFYKHYGIKRTPIVAATGEAIDNHARRVNSSMAEEVIDENVDLEARNSSEVDPDEDQEQRQRKDNENRAIVEGEKLDDIKAKLKNGTPIEELSLEERKIIQAHRLIDPELIDVLKKIDAGGNIAGKAFNSVKSIGSSTDIWDKLCIVNNRLNAITVAARLYRARGMMKYTGLFITASDATRTGKVDPKLMQQLMKRVTSTDANGLPIGASPGFGYALKKRFSKTHNDSLKGSYGVDGKLTGIPKTIGDSIDDIPGVSPGWCRVMQNPGTQIGTAAVEIGAAILTGGSSTAATQTAKVGFTEAMKRGLRSMVSKQTMKSLAKTAAIELSFEGMLTLTELYVKKTTEFNFTGQEKGAELGDYLAGGAGTLNKQRSLAAGLVPATTSQYAQAQNQYIAWKKEQNNNRSLYSKIFDYKNHDSLIFNVASGALSLPLNPNDAIRSAGSNIASIFSRPLSLVSGFTDVLSGKVLADDGMIEYDELDIKGKKLATDPAGNLLTIMREDIASIDPEKNIEDLIASGDIESSDPYAPKSENFKKHIENCVDNIDTISVIENKDSESDPKTDCLATQRITKKYKAHIAYMDMVDGVDALLFPEEIDDSSQTPASSPGTANTGGLIVGDPYSDTTDVQCAEGTKDIGIQDAYVDGALMKSRMCSLLNLPSGGSSDNPGSQYSTPGAEGFAVVNSRVSGAWKKLIDDAKADGINLRANSSFRSMSHQQALWAANPNTSFVARPGYSSHQAGVAIDFANMGTKGGSTCETRATHSSAEWQWLKNNAAKYGFKQLSTEAWHWDAYPSGNRC